MFHLGGQARGVRLDFLGGAQISFRGGQLQELVGILEAARQAVQAADNLLELRALAAKLLRSFRVVPDAGLLELPNYFLQTLLLVVVIKDTSSKSRCAPRDL